MSRSHSSTPPCQSVWTTRVFLWRRSNTGWRKYRRRRTSSSSAEMDGTAVGSFDLIGCPPSALGADHRQPDDIKSPQRESCSVAERTRTFKIKSQACTSRHAVLPKGHGRPTFVLVLIWQYLSGKWRPRST